MNLNDQEVASPDDDASKNKNSRSNETGTNAPSEQKKFYVYPNGTIAVNGRRVEEALFHQVRNHVGKRLPTLVRGAIYNAEKLCGPEHWGKLSKGDRIATGQCIRYLTERGHLDLQEVKTRHEYPVLYALI